VEDAGDAIVVSEDGATSGYDRRPLRTYETRPVVVDEGYVLREEAPVRVVREEAPRVVRERVIERPSDVVVVQEDTPEDVIVVQDQPYDYYSRGSTRRTSKEEVIYDPIWGAGGHASHQDVLPRDLEKSQARHKQWQKKEDCDCEALENENERLKAIISQLSNDFQKKFEDLAGQRDSDYLELQKKYATLNNNMKVLEKARAAAQAQSDKAHGDKDKDAKGKAKKGLQSVHKVPASTGDGFRVYVKDALDLICSVGANPLVRLKMDGVTRETTAHLPSNHPVWNEILTMPDIVRPGAKDRRLTVSVHSKNEDIGTATVELPLGEIDVDAWVPVMKNGKTTGNVHLGIEATGKSAVTLTGKTPAQWRPKSAPKQPDPDFKQSDMPIPSPMRPLQWDLYKMDGEKFWVCLVAKEGKFVLDPAEYKKAPQNWTMSQQSTEAIFNAYNSSYQTAMRRKGLNKLNSYWQKEINDMKGIYLSHLDEQVGGPKAVALRKKEEQILELEAKVQELEASRDDLAAQLAESSLLLADKTREFQDLNRDLNVELAAMTQTTQRLNPKVKQVKDEDVEKAGKRVGQYKDWAEKTEKGVYRIEHSAQRVDPASMDNADLVAEVNALYDDNQQLQLENVKLQELVASMDHNVVVKNYAQGSPMRSPYGSPMKIA
jgi:hypothetical protein